ncbi:MAG: inositol monophosphatase family protein [Devosia sp.]
MMPEIDVIELSDMLREATKAEILPRFRRLDPATIRTKSNPTDLVTEADTEAERWITAAIAKRWPSALVVGEEAVAADPALLHRLAGADLAVTLDPVDGTANFAAGLPLFAVMASVAVKGEVVAGIIYDPMGDDWFVAERGAGAFMRRPDGSSQRLKVADPVPVADTIAHVSISFLDPVSKPKVLSNLIKLRISANYRVAGHDYRTMASGHCHAVLFNKLMPWDHLPGTLICAEAGAYVRKFDGSEYRASDLTGGLLLALDKESWSLLREQVFTV